MMKNIDLGRISIPVDHMASQGNAILGIRGSGKSYTGSYIAERMLDAGVPIVAFDPIGIWRFLRVPAKAGSFTGYQVVVAGGEHGDIPLTAHGAPEIMRAAMRDGISVVFDLYDVAMSKADWRRVVEAVGKVLLYENKKHGLRHIFIEEAAEFVPQRVTDQGGVYSIVERLVRMGGNAQLGVTLINQRAEEVNKAVLELCDLLILHRQKGKNSLASLSKWMDVASVSNRTDVAATIPMLKAGECYVWPEGAEAPTRTQIPEKRTFHPDRKQMQKAVAAESKRADVTAFVTGMRANLAQIVKEAEENDPKRLRKYLASLQAENTQLKAGDGRLAARAVEIDVARAEGYQRGREEGAREGYAAGLRAVQPIADRLGTLSEAVRETVDGFRNDLSRLVTKAVAPVQRSATPAPAPARAAPVKHSDQFANVRKLESSGTGEPMARMPRAMLTALAQHPGGLSKGQVLIHTGYRASGPVSKCFAELSRNGWIESDSWRLLITQPGLAALGSFEPLPTGDELRAHLLNGSKLSSMEKKMLRAIFDTYPSAIGKGKILEQVGYAASGPVSKAFARLVSYGYATKDGRGALKAADEMFS